jgi:pimeloyl-ACP methyl ester carboxylesterase
MSTPIYCISGLGADHRVFTKLQLAGYHLVPVKWVIPTPNESIASYAGRLIAQIPTTNPIIMGISFGGIMAIEISKQIKVQQLILLATCKTTAELPKHFKLFRKFPLYQWLPHSILTTANPFKYGLFGVKGEQDKKLFYSILADMEPKFLKWAIHAILNWKNDVLPKDFIHIHGKDDKTLLYKNLNQVIPLANCGHLLLLSHPKVTADLILDYLEPTNQKAKQTEALVDVNF